MAATRLLLLFLTLVFASAEIITDRQYFTFATNRPRAPKRNVLTVTFKRYVTTLPTVLRGSTLKIRLARRTRRGIAGHATLSSPYIGEAYGWLTAVNIWGGLSGVIHVRSNRPRVNIRLYFRGTPRAGFVGTGYAVHAFSRPPGVRMVKSKLSVAAGVKALQASLNANANGPRLIATIDHSLAAKRVGQVLAPNTVVVFGRPQIGAPLWGRTPEIGIELPMEVHVAESPLGVVYVSYNSGGYMGRRFGLNIRVPLHRFAGIAAGIPKLAAEPAAFDASRARFLQGIRTRSRDGTTAAAAYARLVAAVERAPPVNVAFKIEHDKSAIRAGLTVSAENKVVVFGNPALGTRLMQRSFTAGLDLPAKMGVWNTRSGANKAFVGYVDIAWIVQRHDVAEKQERLAAALRNFQSVALGA